MMRSGKGGVGVLGLFTLCGPWRTVSCPIIGDSWSGYGRTGISRG